MSNYEDRLLIDYIPTVLRKVRQYEALTTGEQPEIYNLFSEIKIALDNQFILTSAEYGVKRWENMLSIIPKATYTLDERKFTILARLAEELPFSYRMLERILTELCGEGGYEIALDYGNYALTVHIALTARNNFNDVNSMLKRIVPANLGISLSLMYNQHNTLRPYTHGQLQAFTHDKLRSEVF